MVIISAPVTGRDRGVFAVNTEGELQMDTKSMVIGALAVGVAIFGYLYYESQQSSVKIDLPGVKIEGK